MPHECTNCNRTFPDGSKEMLSGCPDCGGNKFRYRPSGGGDHGGDGTADGSPATGDGSASPTGSDPLAGQDPGGDDPSPLDPPEDPAPGGSVTDAVRDAGATVRDWVGRGDDGSRSRGSSGDPIPPSDSGDGWKLGDEGDRSDPGKGGDERRAKRDGERMDDDADPEDAAQASARASVVGSDELPDPPAESPAGSPSPDPGSDPDRPGRVRSGRSDPDAGADRSDTNAREGPDVPDNGHGSPDAPDDGHGSPDAPDNGHGSPDAPDNGHEHPGGTDGHDRPDDPGGSGENGTGEEVDLAELRQELDDQFESIRIVAPGQYELNLMELYDREEYIISLMEDGRYAIEVPESWRGDAP